ncbi:glycoside hydrolase family 9 protein [Catenovulum sp. SM1970]|uniref:glycoside hydrolase family 9 protein n=1 Tax=Marinifaba aquimaris TaxID=2741323 RepID=UPI00157364CD|nr:glycoside hydrolase family 9 protein [Marinifaba aquimaris]NTS76887.1 glycoside hydrolase family 9 protein [Marinifaba aquimaris]
MYVKMLLFILCILSINAIASEHPDSSWLRYNHLGYHAVQDKELILMSDLNLEGQHWQLLSANKVVLSGTLDKSLAGKTKHTAKPFNFLIDISSVTGKGEYQLQIEDKLFSQIYIKQQPYLFLIDEMLMHFKTARSGTADAHLHSISHLGDAKAPIYKPKGEMSLGQWQLEKPVQYVDMQGGWYDAADYIKFTLTTAYSAYYLLRAYQVEPALFNKKLSQSDYVDILDEAKHGLDYLLKTYPEKDEFIIQVSTGLDHQLGYRLPENDTRDGKREALSALSLPHMASTAAALALGSQVFKPFDLRLSQQYLAKAKAIYQRMNQPDVHKKGAFERDITNDFYPDKISLDNLALASVELYQATGQRQYQDAAINALKKLGVSGWVAWADVDFSANYRLSVNKNTAALNRLKAGLQKYKMYDKTQGNIWHIPMPPYWGPLIGQFIISSYSGLAYAQGMIDSPKQHWQNLDYFLGKNNWGIAFIASERVPRSVKNIYSQIYQLQNQYPTGAVAGGPGHRNSYNDLKCLFKPDPSDRYFEQFNTSEQIFFDNASNFQTMETTITLQAAAIYMIAVNAKIMTE